MWDRSIDQVQQLIMLLNLIILHCVSYVYELNHRCFRITFIQIGHFDHVKLTIIVSDAFEHLGWPNRFVNQV